MEERGGALCAPATNPHLHASRPLLLPLALVGQSDYCGLGKGHPGSQEPVSGRFSFITVRKVGYFMRTKTNSRSKRKNFKETNMRIQDFLISPR